jgi:hypothetical protein
VASSSFHVVGRPWRNLMKTSWFKSWGLIYRPISFAGVVLTIAAIAFCVHVFLVIDRRSDSAPDTLYNFYPFAAPTFLGLMWIASRTSADPRQ